MKPLDKEIDGIIHEETWVEYFTRCIAELQSADTAADKAGASAEILRGAEYLDDDQRRRCREYWADETQATGIDVTPTWQAMIRELIGMIQAADDELDAYAWAINQLERIGEHMDSIPRGHRLPLPSHREFLEMKREVLEAL